MNLHALSPLHVPHDSHALPADGRGKKSGAAPAGPAGRLDEQTFTALSAELRSYINIRLSDGMSALYASAGPSGGGGAGAGLAGQRDDPLRDADGGAEGAAGAAGKRRRGGEAAGSGHIAAVRMGWFPDLDLISPGSDAKGKRAQLLDDEGNQAWAIEIELARPPEPNTRAGKKRQQQQQSKAAARREQLLKIARLTDLTHLVFLPSKSGAERASTTSDALSYPLLVTKASTSASSDVNRAILTHATNWLQARFDCRLSNAGAVATRRVRALAPPTSATARGNESGGGEKSVAQELEALAEIIIRQARAEKEEIDALTFRGKASRRGINNSDEGHDDSLYAAGPVELAFALPAEVLDDLLLDGSKLPGPAPELNSITLTVPWPVCMRVLDDTEEGERRLPAASWRSVCPCCKEQRSRHSLPPRHPAICTTGTPLLPALRHYLVQHTSLDLSRTTLTRVGAAGINFGVNASACKLKFYDLELRLSSAKLREMQRQRVSLVLHHMRGMIED